MIQDLVTMLAIAWNPFEFHSLDFLPKGRTFNAEYYRDDSFSALHSLHQQDDERKLMINAGCNTSRKYTTFYVESALRLAAQSPYSPDFVPFNSFSSGMLRIASRERFFNHAKNDLRQLVRWSPPSHQKLCTASLSTGWRLEWISKNNGGYCP
jgi:hypothetical protein